MAIQYAGGGRVSAAPTYSPRALLGTSVVGGMTPTERTTAEILASLDGSGEGVASGGGGGGNAAAGLAAAGNIAGILGNLGVMSNDPGLAQFGSTLGTAVGAANLGTSLANAQNIGDVGKAVTSNPAALSAFGVPGLAASGIAGFTTGGAKGALEGLGKAAAYAAAPPLAVVDMTLSLLGMQTLAGKVSNAISNALNAESGTLDNGVTIGGPMGTGALEGTPLGAPTGAEVSFDAPADVSFGSDGGAPGADGGFGVGSGSDADNAGGFGDGTSGMGD